MASKVGQFGPNSSRPDQLQSEIEGDDARSTTTPDVAGAESSVKVQPLKVGDKLLQIYKANPDDPANPKEFSVLGTVVELKDDGVVLKNGSSQKFYSHADLVAIAAATEKIFVRPDGNLKFTAIATYAEEEALDSYRASQQRLAETIQANPDLAVSHELETRLKSLREELKVAIHELETWLKEKGEKFSAGILGVEIYQNLTSTEANRDTAYSFAPGELKKYEALVKRVDQLDSQIMQLETSFSKKPVTRTDPNTGLASTGTEAAVVFATRTIPLARTSKDRIAFKLEAARRYQWEGKKEEALMLSFGAMGEYRNIEDPYLGSVETTASLAHSVTSQINKAISEGLLPKVGKTGFVETSADLLLLKDFIPDYNRKANQHNELVFQRLGPLEREFGLDAEKLGLKFIFSDSVFSDEIKRLQKNEKEVGLLEKLPDGSLSVSGYINMLARAGLLGNVSVKDAKDLESRELLEALKAYNKKVPKLNADFQAKLNISPYSVFDLQLLKSEKKRLDYLSLSTSSVALPVSKSTTGLINDLIRSGAIKADFEISTSQDLIALLPAINSYNARAEANNNRALSVHQKIFDRSTIDLEISRLKKFEAAHKNEYDNVCRLEAMAEDIKKAMTPDGWDKAAQFGQGLFHMAEDPATLAMIASGAGAGMVGRRVMLSLARAGYSTLTRTLVGLAVEGVIFHDLNNLTAKVLNPDMALSDMDWSVGGHIKSAVSLGWVKATGLGFAKFSDTVLLRHKNTFPILYKLLTKVGSTATEIGAFTAQGMVEHPHDPNVPLLDVFLDELVKATQMTLAFKGLRAGEGLGKHAGGRSIASEALEKLDAEIKAKAAKWPQAKQFEKLATKFSLEMEVLDETIDAYKKAAISGDKIGGQTVSKEMLEAALSSMKSQKENLAHLLEGLQKSGEQAGLPMPHVSAKGKPKPTHGKGTTTETQNSADQIAAEALMESFVKSAEQVDTDLARANALLATSLASHEQKDAARKQIEEAKKAKDEKDYARAEAILAKFVEKFGVTEITDADIISDGPVVPRESQPVAPRQATTTDEVTNDGRLRTDSPKSVPPAELTPTSKEGSPLEYLTGDQKPKFEDSDDHEYFKAPDGKVSETPSFIALYKKIVGINETLASVDDASGAWLVSIEKWKNDNGPTAEQVRHFEAELARLKELVLSIKDMGVDGVAANDYYSKLRSVASEIADFESSDPFLTKIYKPYEAYVASYSKRNLNILNAILFAETSLGFGEQKYRVSHSVEIPTPQEWLAQSESGRAHETKVVINLENAATEKAFQEKLDIAGYEWTEFKNHDPQKQYDQALFVTVTLEGKERIVILSLKPKAEAVAAKAADAEKSVQRDPNDPDITRVGRKSPPAVDPTQNVAVEADPDRTRTNVKNPSLAGELQSPVSVPSVALIVGVGRLLLPTDAFAQAVDGMTKKAGFDLPSLVWDHPLLGGLVLVGGAIYGGVKAYRAYDNFQLERQNQRDLEEINKFYEDLTVRIQSELGLSAETAGHISQTCKDLGRARMAELGLRYTNDIYREMPATIAAIRQHFPEKFSELLERLFSGDISVAVFKSELKYMADGSEFETDDIRYELRFVFPASVFGRTISVNETFHTSQGDKIVDEVQSNYRGVQIVSKRTSEDGYSFEFVAGRSADPFVRTLDGMTHAEVTALHKRLGEMIKDLESVEIAGRSFCEVDYLVMTRFLETHFDSLARGKPFLGPNPQKFADKIKQTEDGQIISSSGNIDLIAKPIGEEGELRFDLQVKLGKEGTQGWFLENMSPQEMRQLQAEILAWIEVLDKADTLYDFKSPNGYQIVEDVIDALVKKYREKAEKTIEVGIFVSHLSFATELGEMAKGNPQAKYDPRLLLNLFLRGELGRLPTRKEVFEIMQKSYEHIHQLSNLFDPAVFLTNPERLEQLSPIFEIYTQEFCDALSESILKMARAFKAQHGRPPVIMEIAAGDGRLSRAISDRLEREGFRVTPTDVGLESWHILQAPDVVQMDAVVAAQKGDILIGSWWPNSTHTDLAFDVDVLKVLEKNPDKQLVLVHNDAAIPDQNTEVYKQWEMDFMANTGGMTTAMPSTSLTNSRDFWGVIKNSPVLVSEQPRELNEASDGESLLTPNRLVTMGANDSHVSVIGAKSQRDITKNHPAENARTSETSPPLAPNTATPQITLGEFVELLADGYLSEKFGEGNVAEVIRPVASIPFLLECLELRSKQAGAVEALGFLGVKEAIPQIISLLQEGRLEVRLQAIKALTRLGAREAIPDLKKTLDSPNAYLVEQAQIALEKFEGAPPEKPAIVKGVPPDIWADFNKLVPPGSPLFNEFEAQFNSQDFKGRRDWSFSKLEKDFDVFCLFLAERLRSKLSYATVDEYLASAPDLRQSMTDLLKVIDLVESQGHPIVEEDIRESVAVLRKNLEPKPALSDSPKKSELSSGAMSFESAFEKMDQHTKSQLESDLAQSKNDADIERAFDEAGIVDGEIMEWVNIVFQSAKEDGLDILPETAGLRSAVARILKADQVIIPDNVARAMPLALGLPTLLYPHEAVAGALGDFASRLTLGSASGDHSMMGAAIFAGVVTTAAVAWHQLVFVPQSRVKKIESRLDHLTERIQDINGEAIPVTETKSGSDERYRLLHLTRNDLSPEYINDEPVPASEVGVVISAKRLDNGRIKLAVVRPTQKGLANFSLKGAHDRMTFEVSPQEASCLGIVLNETGRLASHWQEVGWGPMLSVTRDTAPETRKQADGTHYIVKKTDKGGKEFGLRLLTPLQSSFETSLEGQAVKIEKLATDGLRGQLSDGEARYRVTFLCSKSASATTDGSEKPTEHAFDLSESQIQDLGLRLTSKGELDRSTAQIRVELMTMNRANEIISRSQKAPPVDIEHNKEISIKSDEGGDYKLLVQHRSLTQEAGHVAKLEYAYPDQSKKNLIVALKIEGVTVRLLVPNSEVKKLGLWVDASGNYRANTELNFNLYSKEALEKGRSRPQASAPDPHEAITRPALRAIEGSKALLPEDAKAALGASEGIEIIGEYSPVVNGEYAGSTHQGVGYKTDASGRDVNEDAVVAVQTDKALFLADIDGMGGHGNGDVAAQIAVETFASNLSESQNPNAEEALKKIDRALESFNKENKTTAGVVAVALTVTPSNGGALARFDWAGDARGFLIRRDANGKWQWVYRTVDENLGQNLLRPGQDYGEGGVGRTMAGNIALRANVVTNSLGRGEQQTRQTHQGEVPERGAKSGAKKADGFENGIAMQDGDMALLMSDGVSENFGSTREMLDLIEHCQTAEEAVGVLRAEVHVRQTILNEAKKFLDGHPGERFPFEKDGEKLFVDAKGRVYTQAKDGEVVDTYKTDNVSVVAYLQGKPKSPKAKAPVEIKKSERSGLAVPQMAPPARPTEVSKFQRNPARQRLVAERPGVERSLRPESSVVQRDVELQMQRVVVPRIPVSESPEQLQLPKVKLEPKREPGFFESLLGGARLKAPGFAGLALVFGGASISSTPAAGSQAVSSIVEGGFLASPDASVKPK